MSSLLQVCLYNRERDSSEKLCAAIGSLSFVRMVGEVGNSDELATLLDDGEINLVFFHLDPDPDSVIEVIEQVASRFPELAMIAISHETAPAAILTPIRAGCDQFVCEPIDAEDLAAAVGRVAAKRLLTRGKSRCICVVGASGGAGATSIACNLAMEISHVTEKRCALVDLDLQFGDLAINFDIEPKYSLFDLANAGTGLDTTVMDTVLSELPCNVWLLARPETIEQQDAVTSDTVHRSIELLTTMFETVIVDLQRRIDTCTVAAASQADLVLIICQLIVPSIRNAKRYMDALTQQGIPADRIEVVVNRGDSSGGRITRTDLEELIKKPVYASIPNDYQFIARSLDFGKPVATLDEKNSVRVAIRKMARNIVIGPNAVGAAEGQRRGFLSRLLSK